MREYKFRGKRKDNGEWVHGSLIQNYEYSMLKTGRAVIYCDGKFIEVIPETVELLEGR